MILALNSGENSREFGEILGKYRILDVRSVGSKGITSVYKWLKCTVPSGYSGAKYAIGVYLRYIGRRVCYVNVNYR